MEKRKRFDGEFIGEGFQTDAETRRRGVNISFLMKFTRSQI